MMDIEARAPGVIKLLGEHAVVYGKLSLTVAVSLYAKSVVGRRSTKTFVVRFPEWGIGGAELDGKGLRSLYSDYRSKETVEGFIGSKSGSMDPVSLAHAVIAARLYAEHGVDVIGREVIVTSGIPTEKGCASSAASSLAFGIALLKSAGKALDDGDVIDAARDGERIIHRNVNAGGMDVSASYYGGCVSYSRDGGAHREQLAGGLGIVIIDTGPKAPTHEMVRKVSELVKSKPDAANALLDRIDTCSKEGLRALKAGDFETLGRFMNEDQALLRELGVSSKALDKAVDAAIRCGAIGAKLSGGGGGGIAIAIAEDPDALVERLKGMGFNAYRTEISSNGARDYLERKG